MLRDSSLIKRYASENYNYRFNKKTGLFFKWGKTYDEDPIISPMPEILDIELSTSSTCSAHCPFCYKGNGQSSQTNKNMTLETYKTLLSKFISDDKSFITQIAFGICDINTNPDFFPIMEYTKKMGIIPNYTCNGNFITNEIAKKTSKLCGAVAVSVNSTHSYEAISKFISAGMKQVNIHFMLSEETFDKAFSTLDDIKNNPLLKGLNAIVFLQCKEKGNAKNNFHSIKNVEKYIQLIRRCEGMGINYGMDSCSASLYLKVVDGKNKEMVECCESTLSSFYINVGGYGFPCSFAEGEKNWEDGIDVINCKSFVDEVWNNDRIKAFRENNINSSKKCNCNMKEYCRSCMLFDVSSCKQMERCESG